MSLKRPSRTETDPRKQRRHKEDEMPLLRTSNFKSQTVYSAGGSIPDTVKSKAIEQWVSEMDRKKLMASSFTKHARNAAIRYSKSSMRHSWRCFKKLLRRQFMPVSLADDISEKTVLLSENRLNMQAYCNKLPKKLGQMKEIDLNIQQEIHKSAFISNVRASKLSEQNAAAGCQDSNELLKWKNKAQVEADFESNVLSASVDINKGEYPAKAPNLSKECRLLKKLINKTLQEETEVLLRESCDESIRGLRGSCVKL